MGGTVEVLLAPGACPRSAALPALFERYERVMSRFLAESELTRLNASSPDWHTASPLLYDVVAAALAWARRTGGVFDPTLLDALEALGYDRDFETLARRRGDRRARPPAAPPPVAPGRWRAVELDPRLRGIRLPAGVRIDLGGIGKGYTVDRAVAALGPRPNAVVNASGDLYAAGDGPRGDGWLVGVEDPRSPGRDLALLRVRDLAVATSGATRRRWRAGGAAYHHLIDARSGLPIESDALTVTVIAASATAADVLATAIYLSGVERGIALAERTGAIALIFDLGGLPYATPGLRDHLAWIAPPPRRDPEAAAPAGVRA